jgi:transcriptional regulator with XRE-family HTH domain
MALKIRTKYRNSPRTVRQTGEVANGDKDHPVARAIRAARSYAGLSRKQVGAAIDVSAATIGRYERGEWAEPPKQPALDAIGKVTSIHQMLDVFGEPNGEERFERATRREVERRYKRPEPGPGEPPDADDPAGDR